MTKIEQLDMGDDESDETVVVMVAMSEDGTSHYLLHLIAGHLTDPVIERDDKMWRNIQTHLVGNNALHLEIRRLFESGLSTVAVEKQKKICANGPPFVVMNKFPVLTPKGEVQLDEEREIIRPKVTKEDGMEVYTYINGDDLKLRLHEPRSPMRGDYLAGSSSATHHGITIKVKLCNKKLKHTNQVPPVVK